MTEFSRFLYHIGKLGCRTYLEVGCCHGDTFLAIGCNMELAVGVELPESKWGKPGSEAVLRRRVDDLNEKLHVDARVIFGNSREPAVVDQVRELGPFDLVFIDGDHTAEGVLADWENYGGLATKAVAFHDVGGEHIATRGVWELWQRIALTRNSSVYFEDWGDRPMGIGVIEV